MDGYAVAHNIPPIAELELGRFCSFMWHFLTRSADEQARDKLRAHLWQPPPHLTKPIPARSPWSPQSETGAFGALKAQVTGRATLAAKTD